MAKWTRSTTLSLLLLLLWRMAFVHLCHSCGMLWWVPEVFKAKPTWEYHSYNRVKTLKVLNFVLFFLFSFTFFYVNHLLVCCWIVTASMECRVLFIFCVAVYLRSIEVLKCMLWVLLTVQLVHFLCWISG